MERYDTRRYFNVRSKADIIRPSQHSLYRTEPKSEKKWKREKLKSKKQTCSVRSIGVGVGLPVGGAEARASVVDADKEERHDDGEEQHRHHHVPDHQPHHRPVAAARRRRRRSGLRQHAVLACIPITRQWCIADSAPGTLCMMDSSGLGARRR